MSDERRILVVDDDPVVLWVFRDTLTDLGDGYEIVTAQSGLEALDKVKEVPFDLVITDLTMPDLGGVELTEAIRQTSPDTAIVWITAHGCHSVTTEAARLEIRRCCDKPLEVDEILQVVREALATTPIPPSDQH